MDFLTLFLIYLWFILTTIALLCVCLGRKESFLTRSVNGASQVLSFVIPTQLQRVTQRALHRLFHTRSCLFVALHVALQAAVYGEYTWEVFVYCWELQFHLLLLLLPYLLLAGNMGCFILCSRANPGIITKSNHASLVKVYAHDGVLFQKGVVCPTCNMEKPARSKHCSFCGTCVHRFDHHCVWVNNCIGAFNAKYFFLYLFSLAATAAAIATITAAFLIRVVLLSDMMHGSYIDEQGQERAVEILFLVQVSLCCLGYQLTEGFISDFAFRSLVSPPVLTGRMWADGRFFTNFMQLVKIRKLPLQNTLKIGDFSHSTSFRSPILQISVSRLLSLSRSGS
uniref:Palmitoyltransferase n=1 Tax=Otus sunia TaxID=257818 RepID=A0A8C8BHP6_9STRI